MAGNGNVKDLLEELKNLSELMLDLAYSSVFFKNKDIANEVELLYERLEQLEENLYLHLFAASRGRILRKLISIIDIVESAKTVASAAKNMSELVAEGKDLHPIIKSALAESEECTAKCTVLKKSTLVNKSFEEARVRTNTGAHVIAIRRGKKWIFNPKKAEKMLENDILICVGPKNACGRLLKLAHGR